MQKCLYFIVGEVHLLKPFDKIHVFSKTSTNMYKRLGCLKESCLPYYNINWGYFFMQMSMAMQKQSSLGCVVNASFFFFFFMSTGARFKWF